MLSENRLRICFIGDCVPAVYFILSVNADPRLDCLRRHLVTFEPLLSYDPSQVDPTTLRFKDLELDRFVREHPFKYKLDDQLRIDSIYPKPELIVTNLSIEMPDFVFRHASGVCFTIIEKDLNQNRNMAGSKWIYDNLTKELLDPNTYRWRFSKGIDRLAKAYYPSPIVVLLPPHRSIELFRDACGMHGQHNYPLKDPSGYNGMLHDICSENENVFLLEMDREVIDGVLDYGLAPEYYFPHSINSGVYTQPIIRDITHPHNSIYPILIQCILEFYKKGHWIDREGQRYIHSPVSDDELERAAQKLPVVKNDEEICDLINSKYGADFSYGIFFAQPSKDDRFDKMIGERLIDDADLCRDLLLRNTMMDYIKRHPSPVFLPYLTILYELSVENMFRDGYLSSKWLFTQFEAIRGKIFQRNGWNSHDIEKYPPQDGQRIYWEKMCNGLTRLQMKRIALFPAGRHTQRLLPYLLDKSDFEIVALFDERIKGDPQIGGIPLLTPDRLLDLNLDAVIISSDSMEKWFFRRFTKYFLKNSNAVPVSIYGEENIEKHLAIEDTTQSPLHIQSCPEFRKGDVSGTSAACQR